MMFFIIHRYFGLIYSLHVGTSPPRMAFWIVTMNKEPLRFSCILLVLHICLLLITGFDVLYLLYTYSSIVLMSTPVFIILMYILYVLSF